MRQRCPLLMIGKEHPDGVQIKKKKKRPMRVDEVGVNTYGPEGI